MKQHGLPRQSIHTFTDNSETVSCDPDPERSHRRPGVYDVKSGSDGTALDRTKYSES